MKDIFKENSIILIKEDGNIVSLPKLDGFEFHTDAFLRLKEMVPDAFISDELDIQSLNGMEIANHIAANNHAIIWTTDFDEPDVIVATLPKKVNENISKGVLSLFPNLLNKVVMVYNAWYDDSYNVDGCLLYEDGDSIEALEIIKDYAENSNVDVLQEEHIKVLS